MIRMIRVTDGAPANAGDETEAEMLSVQGYRRVDPRPGAAPAPQPEQVTPAAETQADAGGQDAASLPDVSTARSTEPAQVDEGEQAHPEATAEPAARRRRS